MAVQEPHAVMVHIERRTSHREFRRAFWPALDGFVVGPNHARRDALVSYPVQGGRELLRRFNAGLVSGRVVDRLSSFSSCGCIAGDQPRSTGAGVFLTIVHRAAFRTGQRAQCPAVTSTSGGKARAHSGIRNPHRGSNAHPGGKACSGGTVPSIVCKGCDRSVFKSGTASNNPRVYGCAAA